MHCSLLNSMVADHMRMGEPDNMSELQFCPISETSHPECVSGVVAKGPSLGKPEFGACGPGPVDSSANHGQTAAGFSIITNSIA